MGITESGRFQEGSRIVLTCLGTFLGAAAGKTRRKGDII